MRTANVFSAVVGRVLTCASSPLRLRPESGVRHCREGGDAGYSWFPAKNPGQETMGRFHALPVKSRYSRGMHLRLRVVDELEGDRSQDDACFYGKIKTAFPGGARRAIFVAPDFAA